MTQQPSLGHPNWALARTLLDKAFPGSIGFDPDDIASLGPDAWTPVVPADGSDSEIATWLWSTFPPVRSGLIVVVTFASYFRGIGPFFVDDAGLRALAQSHAERYADPFFSGDVAILDADHGRLLVVHHDGLVAQLDGGRTLDGAMRDGVSRTVPDGVGHPNWALAIERLQAVAPGSRGYTSDGIAGLGPEAWAPIAADNGRDASRFR